MRSTSKEMNEGGKMSTIKLIDCVMESRAAHAIMIALDVTSVCLYIVEAYAVSDNSLDRAGAQLFIIPLEMILFSIFSIDYLIRVMRTPMYALTIAGVCNFISLASFIEVAVYVSNHGYGAPGESYTNWLRILRIVNILEILKMAYIFRDTKELPYEPTATVKLSQISIKITRLIISMIMFLFMSAGLVFTLAVNRNSFKISTYDPAGFSWFDALYFVVVTVTTVGYGDIVPYTDLGRFVAFVIIIIGFALLPIQIAEIYSSYCSSPHHLGWFTKSASQPHVCICGMVDYERASRILNESFHSAHMPHEDSFYKRGVVVILSPSPLTLALRMLIELPEYRKRVQYFVGSAQSHRDLERVALHSAIAVYILPDIETSSNDEAERSTVLSSLSVTKYLRSHSASFVGDFNGVSGLASTAHPRIVTKLVGAASYAHILAFAGINTVINAQQFKYQMMGAAAVLPGLAALLFCLSTAGKKLPWTEQTWTILKNRMPEFFDSCNICIHEVAASSVASAGELQATDYRDIALRVFANSEGLVVLLGYQRDDLDGGDEGIVLNPKASVKAPRESDTFLVISPSKMKAIRTLRSCLCLRQYRAPAEAVTSPLPSGWEDDQIVLESTTQVDRSVTAHNMNRVSLFAEIPSDLRDHIVLVVISSLNNLHNKDEINGICHFLRGVRKYSDDPVVILAENATLRDSLIAASRDSSEIYGNVTMVQGSTSSLAALRQCSVTTARIAVAIQPAKGVRLYREAIIDHSNGNRNTGHSLITHDGDAIIASLQLDALSSSEGPSRARVARLTEVNNMSNITYLRLRSASRFGKVEFSTPQVFRHDSDDLAGIADDDQQAQLRFDWASLAAGQVFDDSLLDGLAAQSLGSPHVFAVWEELLGMSSMEDLISTIRNGSSCKNSVDGTDSDHDVEKGNDTPPLQAWEKDHGSSITSMRSLLKLKTKYILGDKDDLRPRTRVSPPLDKLRVPLAFVGMRYGELFAYLYGLRGIMPIALQRRNDYGEAYISVAPHEHITLTSVDEVFAILPSEY